jgi:hypothetical protein
LVEKIDKEPLFLQPADLAGHHELLADLLAADRAFDEDPRIAAKRQPANAFGREGEAVIAVGIGI